MGVPILPTISTTCIVISAILIAIHLGDLLGKGK